MKMRTCEQLIKHHAEMEARARTIGGTVGHFDAKQTLMRCLELPESVVGPYSGAWAMEFLAEVFSDAAKREAASLTDPDFPEDDGFRDRNVRLLCGMSEAAVNAAIRLHAYEGKAA